MFEDWVFHDVSPVFLQLEAKLKNAILSGKLAAGTKLPPIHKAAKALNINSNTVAKAYSYVCLDGLVEHKKYGRYVVIQDNGFIQRTRENAAKSLCYAYYFGMFDLGFTKQEADKMIEEFIREFPHKVGKSRLDENV